MVAHTKGRSLTIPVSQILDVMKIDKKNQGGKKRIVLLKSIGNLYEKNATAVKDEVLEKVMSPGVVVAVPTTTSLPGETTIQVPGSKSISNRALVLAALGKGTCRIRGLLHSDDTQVMLHALRKLGCAHFDYEEDGRVIVVKGGGGRMQPAAEPIYLGNAGTASRFLTTVACLAPSGPIPKEAASPPQAASPTPQTVAPVAPSVLGVSVATIPATTDGLTVPALSPSGIERSTPTPPPQAKVTVLTGNPRMKQRPVGDLVNALRGNGCKIAYAEREGSLPLKIEPTGLPGGRIELSAGISSQYVSSILMAAPYADKEVELCLTGEDVVSQPYIDMTLAMMAVSLKSERSERERCEVWTDLLSVALSRPHRNSEWMSRGTPMDGPTGFRGSLT